MPVGLTAAFAVEHLLQQQRAGSDHAHPRLESRSNGDLAADLRVSGNLGPFETPLALLDEDEMPVAHQKHGLRRNENSVGDLTRDLTAHEHLTFQFALRV